MGPACAVGTFSFLFVLQSVRSDFTHKPMDSECLVNQSTYFNCSSNITAKEIHWYHHPIGVEAHERNTIYAFGKFLNDYEADFVLENNSYNLVIQSVKLSYAGQYECQENGGSGGSAYAELIVLDDEPECNSNINPDGVIGHNTCGIQPEELHLSCSISYHGNIPPHLKWITLGENNSISDNLTTDRFDNRVMHNLTIKADLIKDKSSYECHTTKSRASKHSCTSKTIKLLYIFNASSVSERNIGERVNCSANTSSQSCQYKWRWYNKEDSLTVSNGRTLMVDKEGLHRCEAVCNLRDKQCTVNASFIYATIKLTTVETTSDNSNSSTSVLVGVLVPLLIVVVTVIGIIVVICCRRNKKRKKDIIESQEEEIEGGSLLQSDRVTGETHEMEERQNVTPVAENEELSAAIPLLTQQEDENLAPSSTSPISKHPETLRLHMTSPNEQEHLLNPDQSKDAANVTANPTDGEESNYDKNIDKVDEESTENEPNEDSYIAKSNQKETIERHRDFLKERMDPDYGLLDILRGNKALSGEEISEVKYKTSFYKRNSQLIDIILEKGQCSSLIAALQDSEQIHIVNYLKANGEYEREYGEEWPLREGEILILDTNQKHFIDLLTFSDLLLDHLYSSKVINGRQLEFISSEPIRCKKAEALLEILRRRSVRDYMETIECLNISEQGQFAEIFKSGGVLVPVHSHLDGPSENVDAAEDEISTRIAKQLIDKSVEESSRILKIAQFKVIFAKKGGSIVLYVWCETMEESLRLGEFLTNGGLKDSVEEFFDQFLTPLQKVTVKNITVTDEDFVRLERYFKVDIQRQPASPSSPAAPHSPAVQVMPYTMAKTFDW